MATKVVGKSDWDNDDFGSKDFMQLSEGNNLVRIFSSPYQYFCHWINDKSSVKRKIKCCIEKCPLCQKGEKDQPRWLIGVINRKNGQPSILEIGVQVYKQIKELKNDSWGDPRKYDINIKRKPKGSNPLYVAVPNPASSLSEEEKVLVKTFMDRVDFMDLVKSPSPEEVMELLGLEGSHTAQKLDHSPVQEEVIVSTTDSSNDDEFNFDD